MNELNTYKKLKNKPQDNFPQWLVVHHSAASENQTPQSIEDYHLQQGWEGVGYHFLIDKLGEIWRGRPEHYHGSHVKEQGINTKSLGILVIGDFDKKLPTPQQISSLRGILSDLMAKYSIPVEKIVPHRHFLGQNPYKSCYGSRLQDDWARSILQTIDKTQIKEQIKKLLDLL